MNVQHTERGKLWLVANLRSLAIALAATLKHVSSMPAGQGVPMRDINSILFYYIGTLLVYPLFYGFGDYEISSGAYNLAAYYLCCATVPLCAMFYLVFNLQIHYENATHITKALSVVYFILVVNNVIMAIDAYENLESWTALERLDTFIHGSGEWIIPVGASDIALMVLGLLWIYRFLRSVRW